MYQHVHFDLLLHCLYVFLLEKPKWPSPNHCHLLPRVLGISSQVIFHPFPLFLLSGRYSSTIFFEVPFPVIPHHPLASRFVMSAHPQMRLRSDTPHRLANTFQLSAYDQSTSSPESRLHTGARVNLVLLTYLLTYFNIKIYQNKLLT